MMDMHTCQDTATPFLEAVSEPRPPSHEPSRPILLASFVALSTLLPFPSAAAPTETATNPAFQIQPQATNRAKESVKLVLLKRIRELRLYTENWDGMGAIVPTEQAIDDAETFLRSLPIEQIEAPHIALAADGEINFFWETDKIRMDLGLFGDGTYSYFAKSSDGKKFYCDDEGLEAPLGQEIINLLRRNQENAVHA